MDIDRLYRRLSLLIERSYLDIVVEIEFKKDRLRVYLVDNSFLDIWFSRTIPGKYAFHWERRHIDGTVHRWDNAAHKKYEYLNTFPHHFHMGSDENVKPFKPI